MHVMVMGAGLAGVTTAWYLLQDGHRVTLIDRQPGAGLETSFANGGQLSVSHPEPWANPHAPLQLLRWLGREDAPLLFRPRLDWAQWMWGLHFLRECLPQRTRANTEAIAALAQYSAQQLRQLRETTGLQYDALQRGILHLYFSPTEFQHAEPRAALLRGFNMRVEVCSAQRCLEIEPALRHTRVPLAGGLYALDDESGDAHLFCQALAARCQQAGATLRFGLRIQSLQTDGDTLTGVVVSSGDQSETLTADAYVMALGSHSRGLAASVGASLRIYPVKGYSVTMPATEHAPFVSVTDESRRIVYSRLGDRLRIAGTAELNGYDLTPNPARSNAILRRALEIFPGAGQPDDAVFWAGLRPAVPSNRPYIGRLRHRNLFYNTGHGTLGWTLCCGSARSLAHLINNQPPAVAFPFLT